MFQILILLYVKSQIPWTCEQHDDKDIDIHFFSDLEAIDDFI